MNGLLIASTIRRRLVPIALACISLGPVTQAAAANGQKKVLVLYSTRRDTQIAAVGDREMPLLFQQGLPSKPDYYSEYIDRARFPEEQYRQAFTDYLRLKYSSSRFDLLIAVNNTALEISGVPSR